MQSKRIVASLKRRLLPCEEDRRKLRLFVTRRLCRSTNDVERLNQRKQSDVLFVLGSGRSINELNDEQWQQIKASDTIGFNFWLYNDFVPTYYHIEAHHQPVVSGLASTSWLHFQEMWRRKPEFHHSHLLMSLPETSRSLTLGEFISWLIEARKRSNIYFYESTLILRHKPEVPIAEVFSQCPRDFNHPLLRPASNSLGVVIGLAVALGYKKIVLLGIDLKHSEYFWKRWNIPYDHLAQSPQNTDKKQHLTMTSTYGVPVDQVIRGMFEGCLGPSGIELFIGSAASALYPLLPLWEHATPPEEDSHHAP